ncbi:hypothetical protein DERF_012420 [Dermatophagoides farinae]|uniref:Uncharacterized protein n=1 Tax=Dermatophagoides farinae TaxID=6954 RepID=A0A922HPY0_DERFA|nr:hypothetical protein DERF_012420 [Dermatophagoides farinae]
MIAATKCAKRRTHQCDGYSVLKVLSIIGHNDQQPYLIISTHLICYHNNDDRDKAFRAISIRSQDYKLNYVKKCR